MKVDVAGEVAGCLKNAPGGDCTTDQVKAWLFTSQNCVAARLRRILQDKAARDLLTDAAARTWRRVTDPEGKAQRLWSRLNSDLVPLGKSKAKALQEKVDYLPKSVFARLFSPKHTRHDVALMLWDWTRKPLAIKADLIFPYHGAWGLLPADKGVWIWAKLPHARKDAVEIAPVGDFLAAMVMNRLGMVVSLTTALSFRAEGGAGESELAHWNHALDEELLAVRNEIWDTPDAQERAGAMALLQAYLALEEYQRGFEADWSVIPWPPKPENKSLFIYDTPEDAALFDGPDSPGEGYRRRGSALGYTLEQALKNSPGDAANIVKGGLEWLMSRVGPPAQAAPTGQAPSDREPVGAAPERLVNMSNHAPTDLTIGEVDSLLADFRWLANPPAPVLPQRDETLWRKAVDDEWRREEELAARRGKRLWPGTKGYFEQSLEAVEAYRRLDPAFFQAKAEAIRKAADDAAAVRKHLDLLLVSVKTPLLEWSELASTDYAQAWNTYLSAVQYDAAKKDQKAEYTGHAAYSEGREDLDAVIQDLERIKAKMQRQAKVAPQAQPAPDGGKKGEPAEANAEPPNRKRGRPKEYSAQYKADCEAHYQEWRTFFEAWKRDGKKGSARLAFAKSKNMKQAKSDAMIRYGTPARKKSRRKSRR